MRSISTTPQIALGILLLTMSAVGQSPTPSSTTQPTNQTTNQTQPAQRKSSQTSTTPATPAAPTGTTPADAARDQQQRLADQKLLQQQEARSRAEQRTNEQMVQQKMVEEKRVDNEVRVQDAPGPAQTGVLPGVPVQAVPQSQLPRVQDAPGQVPGGTPVQVVSPDQTGVHDAPGPAQTIPTLPATPPPA